MLDHREFSLILDPSVATLSERERGSEEISGSLGGLTILQLGMSVKTDVPVRCTCGKPDASLQGARKEKECEVSHVIDVLKLSMTGVHHRIRWNFLIIKFLSREF